MGREALIWFSAEWDGEMVVRINGCVVCGSERSNSCGMFVGVEWWTNG